MRTEAITLFELSRPFLFFEYVRIPHRTAPDGGPGLLGEARWNGSRRALYWISAEAVELPAAAHRVGSIPLHARVVPDAGVHAWLPGDRGSWSPTAAVEDAAGAPVASIWRDERGSVFLPFDPAEAIRSFWSEGYQSADGPGLPARAKRLAMWSYYRVRPALPRRAQIGLRRLFSRVQARSSFPRWPVETALHDLYDLLFGIAAEVAGEPVPWIAPWPDGRSCSVVLTHDVETSVGVENVQLLRDVEVEAGFRSSWNFVPKRYPVDDALIQALVGDGFEVGVHGLYHDGRDLESLATLRQRLPAIREYAERWHAVGFRSPATHRSWELMPLLGFDYDSSYPDTDPFEPQSGGCCSWLPFFNEDLVELPITLPQDHTVFVILRRPDEALWLEKASFLRSRGGMTLLITHPDYMLDDDLLGAYARFLRSFEGDESVWRALPSEVSAWWRRRAASRVEREGDEWRIAGPAAGEARVAFAEPDSETVSYGGV